MIAREGWPWIMVVVIASGITYRVWGAGPSAAPMLLVVWLFFLFRDPGRDVPSLPLAIVSPVDGRVTEIVRHRDGELPGEWTKIAINTNHLGAYAVRSPIEGTIGDVRDGAPNGEAAARASGLWVRSEEQDDVILLFPGRQGRFGPKAFVRYGERVGQGQRFAYLRLAPRAEVYFPVTANVRVGIGDRVLAGSAVLAELADK
jgi:phosphatidylserine decarboxylase